MNTLYVYLIGTIIIGLPMALLSLWFYKLEEKLDYHKHARLLKLVRNFIHPGSFGLTPSYEHYGRSNYKFNYEGPIGEFLGVFSENNGPIEMMYIILSSLVWPIRIMLSVVNLGAHIAASIAILPFIGLHFLCKLVAKTFRLVFNSKTGH